MTIGDIKAATGCGRDSGCFISAPVGDAWVEIVLSTHWSHPDGGYYSGLTPDAILAQMQPLAASVFTALTDAQPGQLGWPAVELVELVEREPDCTGALGSQGIASSLGIDSFEYEVRSSSSGSTYFDNYVAQRSGRLSSPRPASGHVRQVLGALPSPRSTRKSEYFPTTPATASACFSPLKTGLSAKCRTLGAGLTRAPRSAAECDLGQSRAPVRVLSAGKADGSEPLPSSSASR